MQVILHLWNLNLQGAPGGPTAFGVNTARPTGLSSAAPRSRKTPKRSPHGRRELQVVKTTTASPPQWVLPRAALPWQAREENCS